MDNWEVKFIAADCAFVNTTLRNRLDIEKEEYLKQCVNIAAGEKPVIRIPSPWNFFNMTNWASFENIIFTGEDLFVNATNNG